MKGMERAYDLDRYVTDESRPGILRRFESKYAWDDGGCWNWLAATNEWGYGILRLGSRRDSRFPRIGVGAHRLSYVLYKGPVGLMCVLHKCDNAACVNPEHLYLGTFKDNSFDQIVRNRLNRARGVQNSASKLTESDVVAIRASAESHASLARKYRVHSHTIENVRNRQNWRHIA